MAGQTVIVSVLADTKRFDAGLNKASASLRNFSRGVSKFSGVVTVGVGIAAAAFTKFVASSVMSAAELEQALGGSEVVFGNYYKNIEMWGTQAYKNLGLSQNDYIQSANVLGVFLKGAGISAKNLAGETDKLLQRGADVSALFGGTATEAIDAFGSALKGEYNPIEKYGVVLSEAIVQRKAFAMTGKTVASTLTAEEKQAARLALIYEKTDIAQGRFAAEAGTFAGALAIFNARLQNFLNDVGTNLLPVLAEVLPELTTQLNDFVKKPEFKQFIEDLTVAIQELAKALPGIVRGFVDAFGWAIKNREQLAQFATAVLALGPGLQFLGYVTRPVVFLFEALAGVVLTVVAGWKTFQKVIKPTVITSVTRKLVLWNKEWANTDNVFTKAWQRFVVVDGYIKSIGENIDKFTGKTKFFARAAQGFLKIAKPILYFIADITEFPGVFVRVFSPIINFLSKFGGLFSKVFGAAFGFLSKFGGLVTLIFYGAQVALAEFIALFQGWVYLFQRAWQTVSQVFSDIYLIVSTLLGRLFGAIAKWFSDTVAAVGKWFTDLGAWFVSTPVGEWVMGFIASLGDAWTAVTEWWNSEGMKPFRDFLSGVWEALTDPFWLFKISNDFFQGLLNGFKDNVDKIFDWFDNLWADIIGGAKKALGIASPSKVMKAIGKNLGQGLAIGIDSTQNLVTRASDGLFSATLGGFDTPFSPAPAGASGGSGAVYNVTVNALTPSPEVGRVVVKSIQDYERTGGTR